MAMDNLRLVRIESDGRPGAAGLVLSEMAAAVCQDTANLYAAAGFEPPWIGYLAVIDDAIVGTCAFNTTTFVDPADNGVTEIAYFTFPDFEGQGIATEMGRRLVELARSAVPSISVVAQTEPEANASTRVLEKLGFDFIGPVAHDELGTVWEWRLAAES
ncbi:MAG: GNAT family N-acetyltransferase [Gammaproteobacteria bacterium]|nr:GNAT family N-acetyltransferase [Gammaproteobacteria bacterium]MDH5309116.1 GNAT family N-acetyltransferase [Gammaproteobacteria bacterium]